VARLLHAPPPPAARGFTRCRESNRETGHSRSASSPLSPYAGGEGHCHLQQQKNTQMAVGFNFSFLYRSTSLSLLLHFGSASLYRSVLFLCFLILLCFRWQRSWRCRRCGPGVDGFRSSWYIWRRPWKERWRPVCAKESWWMRKGTASVGAAVSTAAGFFGGRRLWTGLLLLLLCGLMEGNRRAWERGALGWRRRWGDGCQGEEDGMRCGCGCCVLCDVRLWAAAWKKQNQNRGKGRRRCGYGVEGEAVVFGLRELSSWLAGRKEIWWRGKGRRLQEKGEKEGGAAAPFEKSCY